MEVSVSVKALCTETQAFLEGKQVSAGQKPLGVPVYPTHPLPSLGAKAAHSQPPLSQQLDSPQQEDALHQALGAVGQELQRFSDVHWMAPITSSVEEVGTWTGGGAASQRAAASRSACGCFSMQEPTGCLGRRPRESPGQLLAGLLQAPGWEGWAA